MSIFPVFAVIIAGAIIYIVIDIAFESASAWADDDSARHDRYRPALKMLEEEEAAYVAQALFLPYEGLGGNAVGEVAEAAVIARQIKGQDEAHVTDEMQAGLKAAILADPDYQKELRETYWTWPTASMIEEDLKEGRAPA